MEAINTKPILIITSSVDYTVDYIIDKFKDIVFYRLNVDLFNNYNFIITNSGWKIESTTWKITNKDIEAIYYRKPILPELSDIDIVYHQMIQRDIISIIDGISDSFDGIVLTRPNLLRKTENKIYQLQVVNRMSIQFPDSIIGNNSDAINTYQHQKIIKPITTGKVKHNNGFEIFQTNLLKENVDDISLMPIYIQEYIEKSYEARITYLNGVMWGVRIDTTNKIDWRKNDAINEYSIIKIPESIQLICNKIMTELGLIFGAFDFIINKQGEWIFLEVNPNGQWLWLEKELNLNISVRLIKYLSGDKND